uniref:Endonuclease/exonuclease/phosphatase domain-containing protein n=1 Tax=Solanum tuberosum TaxID=4113 RepID=M1BXS4_SOLTU
MKRKIVSWNVRGLNDQGKKRIVKSHLLDWKADIVCLQETKLEGNCQDHIKQIGGGRWTRFVCLEASGTRGGIIMM